MLKILRFQLLNSFKAWDSVAYKELILSLPFIRNEWNILEREENQ